MPIATRLSQNKATVEVDVPSSSMTAEQIDQLIAEIAAVRIQMIPEVAQSFPQGKPTHRHDGTRYFFGIDPFSKLLHLSFRSPAFGWLTFAIPEEEFERMYRQLQESKGHLAAPRSDRAH
jgi:hypothetical protein